MRVWNWLRTHTDHLIAGVVASIPVSIATNVVMHHMGWILTVCHVPAVARHWMGF
jgi:uncharacterized membrane protein